MKKNEEDKALIKVHLGIFNKIRNFFRSLFCRELLVQEKQDIVSEKYNNNFKETVQIKQDEEELRILKLQQEFKNSNIEEEEISEDDYSKLIRLYDEQNEKLRQEIEKYKIETYKILQEIKKG